MKLAYNIFRLLRPRQWIKNLAVFAAITFSGELFNLSVLDKVIIAFIVLSGLSSATYIINDIFDRESDRLHPFKKSRPLANKDIPISLAIFIAVILATVSFYLGLKYVTLTFFIIALIYIILQFLYSLFLKSVAVADILVIAAGYILRVYAGEFASGFHISVWLLLAAISLSLFLAVGKRKSELKMSILQAFESLYPIIRKDCLMFMQQCLPPRLLFFILFLHF